MLNKEDKILIFENSRLIFYAVLVIAGIVVCCSPFNFTCNYEGYSCLFCGMRRAIDYIVVFEFQKAVESNPLILYIAVILIDLINILIRKFLRLKSN